MMNFEYRDVGVEGIDVIAPLWHSLRAYHAGLPGWRFGHEMRDVTFDSRKQGLVEKAAGGGALNVEVVSVDGEVVGYCVSSLTAEGEGEIDSLFVEEGYRGCGVGRELVRRGMRWLSGKGAKSVSVAVAEGNEGARRMYEGMGFCARTVVMRFVPGRGVS